MKAYRIANWREAHENYDTDKRADGLQWIQTPTYHDRGGFRQIMHRPDGLAIYGAYVTMAQISGKLPRAARGWLIDRDGRPLDPAKLAIRIGGDQNTYATALKVLAEEDPGWLVLEEIPEEVCAVLRKNPQASARLRTSAEKTVLPNRTETETEPNLTVPDITEPNRTELGNSASGSLRPRNSDSASVRARQIGAVTLINHLEQRFARGRDAPQRDADRSTIERLVRFYVVENGIDPQLIHDLAEEKCRSPTARNPIATFLEACKARWGTWKTQAATG